jgi:hypothetical protein
VHLDVTEESANDTRITFDAKENESRRRPDFPPPRVEDGNLRQGGNYTNAAPTGRFTAKWGPGKRRGGSEWNEQPRLSPEQSFMSGAVVESVINDHSAGGTFGLAPKWLLSEQSESSSSITR